MTRYLYIDYGQIVYNKNVISFWMIVETSLGGILDDGEYRS